MRGLWVAQKGLDLFSKTKLIKDLAKTSGCATDGQ
jgi:hypothetical protein